MKLIRIISNKDSYIVDAESSVKFLGFRVFSRIRKYKKQKDSNTWYRFPDSSKVSARKEEKLNKWIEDHEKFVLSADKK